MNKDTNRDWLIKTEELKQKEEEKLPTVLLLGDSIRMQYQARVQEKLQGVATVIGPNDNGRYTKYTLWCMHEWIANYNRKIDLIHWNNGIWDMHFVTADNQVFTPVSDYIKDNERLYIQLKSYTVKLIWATITPFTDLFPSDRRELTVQYNEAAVGLLKSRGVRINDLYSLVKANIDRYVCEDGAHLSAEGIEACADAAAECIKKRLSE